MQRQRQIRAIIMCTGAVCAHSAWLTTFMRSSLIDMCLCVYVCVCVLMSSMYADDGILKAMHIILLIVGDAKTQLSLTISETEPFV